MDNSSRDILPVLSDHFPCLLRNLYVGQEATVRTLYGANNWFKIEKGVHQDYVLSPCFFLIYTQSTESKMLGWMSYKLELRLLGEISTILDTQMIPPL